MRWDLHGLDFFCSSTSYILSQIRRPRQHIELFVMLLKPLNNFCSMATAIREHHCHKGAYVVCNNVQVALYYYKTCLYPQIIFITLKMFSFYLQYLLIKVMVKRNSKKKNHIKNTIHFSFAFIHLSTFLTICSNHILHKWMSGSTTTSQNMTMNISNNNFLFQRVS